MDRETRELLERGVAAIERLAEDPVIEVETKPPVCPHCEKINPNVRVQESEAEGKLAEFVIQAQCLNCHKPFFAIPMQWEVATSGEEVRQMISERIELRGFNQG
jgi:hypothetical protein